MPARFAAVAITAIALTGCDSRKDLARAPYRPIVEVEAAYGPLITAGNHPTPNQHGTGERVGLFRDTSGTIWGFPVIMSPSGEIRACAPSSAHQAQVTDNFSAGSTVIGSTNAPTGWRDGTGQLELLLRDQRGTVRWRAVRGGRFASRSVCEAPQSPGPPQQLDYYRLAPEAGR
jgi:hypothetical protein